MGGGFREQPRAALPAAGEPERANLARRCDRAGGFHDRIIGGGERDFAEQSRLVWRSGRTEICFVADSGNNRVLEFPSGAGSGAAAVRVFGQPGMNAAVRPTQASAQTLASPLGIAVDPASNLYVADAGNNRLLIFPNTQNAPDRRDGCGVRDRTGELQHEVRGGTLKTPTDVGVDSSGNIYVADNGDNRVLIYPSLVFLPLSGGTPTGLVGQSTSTVEAPNYNSPDGLATAGRAVFACRNLC